MNVPVDNIIKYPEKSPATAAEFSELFPPRQKAAFKEYLWRYKLPYPVHEIWPVITDTSTLNRELGLPPMQLNEIDGRVYGVSKMGGFTLEWEELPWQWMYGRFVTAKRLYSKGIARSVRVVYYLEKLAPDETLFSVYFRWLPRRLTGRTVLSLGMNRFKKIYGTTVETLIERNRRNKGGAGAACAAQIDQKDKKSVATDKVEIYRSKLKELSDFNDAVDLLCNLVVNGSDDELDRIKVRKLAADSNIHYRRLLEVCLYAVKEGMLTLSWDTICPHCRGVRSEIEHLGDLIENDSCEACGIDFKATDLDSYEVTFHVSDHIRKVEKKLYCAAEPAEKNHMLVSITLEPGQGVDATGVLAGGIYRLRTADEKDYCRLTVKDPGADSFRYENGLAGEFSLNYEGELVLYNSGSENHEFVIEEFEHDQYSLRPSDLFNFQQFRNLFAAEALSAGLKLDVGEQIIMFTDIVGSSRFYHNRGDADAFSHVRSHFVEIYSEISENGGAVIKTVGDAAMASFNSADDALRAAAGMQHYFENPENTPLRLRITIHSGPCLAVKLNSGIDYFGNTVNLAAKIQSAAGPGEVVVTESFIHKLSDQTLADKAETVHFYQKWNYSYIDLFRLKEPPVAEIIA